MTKKTTLLIYSSLTLICALSGANALEGGLIVGMSMPIDKQKTLFGPGISLGGLIVAYPLENVAIGLSIALHRWQPSSDMPEALGSSVTLEIAPTLRFFVPRPFGPVRVFLHLAPGMHASDQTLTIPGMGAPDTPILDVSDWRLGLSAGGALVISLPGPIAVELLPLYHGMAWKGGLRHYVSAGIAAKVELGGNAR